MVQINFASREVNCKVVYYGPGMSGKTTNLEVIHRRAPEEHRGALTSISTDGDRTLYFDFMPLDLGTVAGMRTKFQLYTVPGQVYYNSTRRLVLQGADGIVFVADSSRAKRAENLESWVNLQDNLRESGLELRDLPHVLQLNKRDLPDAMSVSEMVAELNKHGAPVLESVATTGEGVFPTLKELAGMVLERIQRADSRRRKETEGAAVPARGPAVAAATSSGSGAGATEARGASSVVGSSRAGASGPRPDASVATLPGSPRISRWGDPALVGAPAPSSSSVGVETGRGSERSAAASPERPSASRPPAAPAAPAAVSSRSAPASPRATRPAGPRAPATGPPRVAVRIGGERSRSLLAGAIFGILVTAAATAVFLLFAR